MAGSSNKKTEADKVFETAVIPGAEAAQKIAGGVGKKAEQALSELLTEAAKLNRKMSNSIETAKALGTEVSASPLDNKAAAALDSTLKELHTQQQQLGKTLDQAQEQVATFKKPGVRGG